MFAAAHGGRACSDGGGGGRRGGSALLVGLHAHDLEADVEAAPPCSAAPPSRLRPAVTAADGASLPLTPSYSHPVSPPFPQRKARASNASMADRAALAAAGICECTMCHKVKSSAEFDQENLMARRPKCKPCAARVGGLTGKWKVAGRVTGAHVAKRESSRREQEIQKHEAAVGTILLLEYRGTECLKRAFHVWIVRASGGLASCLNSALLPRDPTWMAALGRAAQLRRRQEVRDSVETKTETMKSEASMARVAIVLKKFGAFAATP